MMMANERGLCRLDAGCREHALLTADPACVEQETDQLPSLDQRGEGSLNASRRIQIQLQWREDLFLVSAVS
jgi:hypothetical protein